MSVGTKPIRRFIPCVLCSYTETCNAPMSRCLPPVGGRVERDYTVLNGTDDVSGLPMTGKILREDNLGQAQISDDMIDKAQPHHGRVEMNFDLPIVGQE